MAAAEIETAWFRCEGGVVLEMDLPLPEGIGQRVRQGAIVRVAGPDGAPYVEAPDEPEVPGPPTTRPAPSASKSDWVGWAVTFPDESRRLSEEAALAMTKPELIDLFGNDH